MCVRHPSLVASNARPSHRALDRRLYTRLISLAESKGDSAVSSSGELSPAARIRLVAPLTSLPSFSAGVPRFIFVSVHDYNLPSGIKDSIGYFVGKKKAEARITELYSGSGGFILAGLGLLTFLVVYLDLSLKSVYFSDGLSGASPVNGLCSGLSSANRLSSQKLLLIFIAS